MNTFQKVKKILLIAMGFGLATYLIMSGSAMLTQDQNSTMQEK